MRSDTSDLPVVAKADPEYPAHPGTTDYLTEIPYNPSTSVWREVAGGIADGSWAVLLFLAVTFFYAKKPLERYFDKQVEVLDKVKDTLDQNTNTLQQMQQLTSDLGEHLGMMSQQSAADHSKMIDKLDLLLDTLQK